MKSVWWDNVLTKDKSRKLETILLVLHLKIAIALCFKNQLGENVEDWTWDRVMLL